MPFEFGDIVPVPFPFTSQAASKKRPAVVVSGRVYNATMPDAIPMAVTSQLRAGALPGEVWLQDWRAAGLLKPSAIKPVFATLEQALVIRQLGALASAGREALRKAIAQTLGRSAPLTGIAPNRSLARERLVRLSGRDRAFLGIIAAETGFRIHRRSCHPI